MGARAEDKAQLAVVDFVFLAGGVGGWGYEQAKVRSRAREDQGQS